MSTKEQQATQELGQVLEARDVFGKKYGLFEKLVENHCSLKETEKLAKEERGYTDNGKRVKGLDDKIRDFLADIKAVLLPDGRKVQVVERAGNRHLDVNKLLAEGVPATTINKCYSQGAPSWFILVSEKKS